MHMGGGLYVKAGSEAVIGVSASDIDPPQIVQCTAIQGGGVCSSGQITMNAGQVTQCNSTINGGGLFLTGDTSIFSMKGGTVNKNTSDNGGGVFVYLATFNMSGGDITSCNVTAYGGGVSMNGGTMNMEARDANKPPIIEKCSATAIWGAGKGGGIYATGNGKIKLNDAIISDSTAQVTFPGPDPTKCYASGGGIYLEPDATANLVKGKISNCTAQFHGGGVFTRKYENLTTTTDVEFSGNKAKFYRIPGDNLVKTPNQYPCTKAGSVTPDVTSQLDGRKIPLNNYDINYLSYIVKYYENAKCVADTSSSDKGPVERRIIEYAPFESGDTIGSVVHQFETIDNLRSVNSDFTYTNSKFKGWSNAVGYVKYNIDSGAGGSNGWFTMHQPGGHYTFGADMLVADEEKGANYTGYLQHQLTSYALWQKKLTIKKEVKGLFADLTKTFDINVGYKDIWWGDLQGADAKAEFPTSFSLKNNQSSTSFYVYEEMRLEMSESSESAAGYTVTYKVNDGAEQSGFSWQQLMNYDDEDITVTVINRKNEVPITGISSDSGFSAMLIIMGGLAGVGAVAYFYYRRKRRFKYKL